MLEKETKSAPDGKDSFQKEKTSVSPSDVRTFIEEDPSGLKKQGSDAEEAISSPSSTGSRTFAERAYVIDPTCSARINWDLTLGVFILYSAIIIPFRLGFDVRSSFYEMVFDLMVDSIFGIDIFLNFNTGFYDENDILVVDRNLLTRQYVRGWFPLDLVSTVPFDLIAAQLGTSTSQSLNSLKVFRIFRMMRLLKLARLTKLSKVLRSLEDAMHLNQAMVRLIRLLFNLLFAAHLLACCWWAVAINQPDPPEDNWAYKYRVLDAPLHTQYVSSLYWSVCTMTAVGYGDLAARTDTERIYSIVTQMVGAVVFGFLIGNISTLLESMDVRASRCKMKVAEIREYMVDRRLPKSLQLRIRRYYEHYLEQRSVFEEAAILSELSPALRRQLVHTAHRDVVANINLFIHQDDAFITAMLLRMKPFIAVPGEVIAVQGEVVMDMFFVNKGTVEVYFRLEDQDYLLGTMRAGSHFGEVSLLKRTPRTINVRARTFCDCYSLAKEDLQLILANHPKAKERMMQLAAIRRKKLDDAYHWLISNRNQEKQEAAAAAAQQGGLGVPSPLGGAANSPNSMVQRSSLEPSEKSLNTISTVFTFAQKWLHNTSVPEADSPVDRDTHDLSKLDNFLPTDVTTAPTEPKYIAPASYSSRARGSGYSEHSESSHKLWKKGILYPYSPWRQRWDVLMACFILYSVIYIPYRFGFEHEPKGAMLVMDITADAFFGVDILLNFRTAFYEDGRLMTASGALARRYLRGWFLLDFVATAPLYEIVQLTGAATAFVKSLKLIRILRLARLLKILHLSSLINVLEGDWEVNPAAIKLMKLLLEVTLIAHFMSCGWYYVSHGIESNFEQSCVDPCAFRQAISVTVLEDACLDESTTMEQAILDATTSEEIENCNVLFDCEWWVYDGLQSKRNIISHYIASTYWTFTTMTTVGYGDIVAGTDIERLYAVLSMLVGVTVFGYVIGSMASLVSKIAEPGHRQREKMEEIKYYLREQQVGKELSRKVFNHFETFMRSGTVFDEASIMRELTPRLRREVVLHVNMEATQSLPLFRLLSPEAATQVFNSLGVSLLGGLNDYLFQGGDEAAEVYFVLKGELEVVLSPGPQERVVQVLESGSMFGELGCFVTGCRTAAVRTSFPSCELLVAHKEQLEEWAATYPLVAKRLEQMVSGLAARVECGDVAVEGGHVRTQGAELARAITKAKGGTFLRPTTTRMPSGRKVAQSSLSASNQNSSQYPNITHSNTNPRPVIPSSKAAHLLLSKSLPNTSATVTSSQVAPSATTLLPGSPLSRTHPSTTTTTAFGADDLGEESPADGGVGGDTTTKVEVIGSALSLPSVTEQDYGPHQPAGTTRLGTLQHEEQSTLDSVFRGSFGDSMPAEGHSVAEGVNVRENVTTNRLETDLLRGDIYNRVFSSHPATRSSAGGNLFGFPQEADPMPFDAAQDSGPLSASASIERRQKNSFSNVEESTSSRSFLIVGDYEFTKRSVGVQTETFENNGGSSNADDFHEDQVLRQSWMPQDDVPKSAPSTLIEIVNDTDAIHRMYGQVADQSGDIESPSTSNTKPHPFSVHTNESGMRPSQGGGVVESTNPAIWNSDRKGEVPSLRDLFGQAKGKHELDLLRAPPNLQSSQATSAPSSSKLQMDSQNRRTFFNGTS